MDSANYNNDDIGSLPGNINTNGIDGVDSLNESGKSNVGGFINYSPKFSYIKLREAWIIVSALNAFSKHNLYIGVNFVYGSGNTHSAAEAISYIFFQSSEFSFKDSNKLLNLLLTF